jgi:acetoin utilization deacetylase AcuC-like enzyme
MPRRLFYCDHHEIPLPEGHRFPLRKYRLLREALAADGLFHLEPAAPADPGDIALAHDPEYVRQFIGGALPDRAMRRIGFPWSQGLVRRTLASVGGTLGATRDALACGLGGTLAGGTHHAFRAEGSGFCVFNDVAVAIHWLRARQLCRRIAVVDLDVHQGDGTAHFFEHDSDVLTVSIHGTGNFPFEKQRSSIDIGLADRTGDLEYLRVLDEVLPRVCEFEPEIIYYLSGVDALASDGLGRLALSLEGLMARDQKVLGACHSLSIPVAITLGGGYSDPIERTVEAHANTFRVAAQVFGVPQPL